MIHKALYIILCCCLTVSITAQQDTLFSSGVKALSTGNSKQASILLKSDVANDPSYEGYFNLSLAYTEEKNWNGAFWAVEEALKWNPTSRIAIDHAKKVVAQLENTPSWEHPYSWTKRIIISVPLEFWYSLALISALLIAYFIFCLITKGKAFRLYNYRYLTIIFAIVFVTSIVNGVIVNQHFTFPSFVYAKAQNQQLYASQNGIVLKQSLKLGNRYAILSVNDDWVKVKYHDDQPVWVPKTAVYIDESID